MTVKRIKFKLIRIKAWTLGSCLIERLNSLQASRTSRSCGRVRQVEVVDLVGVYDGKSGSPKTIHFAITNRLSGSPEGSVVADDGLFGFPENSILDFGRQLFGFSGISILDLGGNYCIQRNIVLTIVYYLSIYNYYQNLNSTNY